MESTGRKSLLRFCGRKQIRVFINHHLVHAVVLLSVPFPQRVVEFAWHTQRDESILLAEAGKVYTVASRSLW